MKKLTVLLVRTYYQATKALDQNADLAIMQVKIEGVKAWQCHLYCKTEEIAEIILKSVPGAERDTTIDGLLVLKTPLNVLDSGIITKLKSAGYQITEERAIPYYAVHGTHHRGQGGRQA